MKFRDLDTAFLTRWPQTYTWEPVWAVDVAVDLTAWLLLRRFTFGPWDTRPLVPEWWLSWRWS
jgi:hypothetical protein